MCMTYIGRLGSTDLHRPAYILEQSKSDAIIHPDFDLSNANRVQPPDIALLKLSGSIPYGPNIQPIRLQSSEQKDNNYENQVVVVSGFGYEDDSWNGDSGGPLTIVDKDGEPTMVGIVHYASWRGCTSEWPTAYVRPRHFQDWLNQATGINFDWSYADIENASNTFNSINK